MANLEEERRFNILTGGEPGLVTGGWNMGGDEEGGRSPYEPYKPAPSGPYSPPPKRKPDNMTIAHHTGGKHFTEPTMDELIQGIINGDIPKGTLGPEEDRMIEDYKNRNTNQSLLISGAQDLDTKMGVTTSGGFPDEDGNFYIWSPRGQKFIDMGPYDPDLHGLPVPLA
tara:strand:+ start:1155 stop:1661 length:507 start_codon:yes stop_codon:yes gene_type:complete